MRSIECSPPRDRACWPWRCGSCAIPTTPRMWCRSHSSRCAARSRASRAVRPSAPGCTGSWSTPASIACGGPRRGAIRPHGGRRRATARAEPVAGAIDEQTPERLYAPGRGGRGRADGDGAPVAGSSRGAVAARARRRVVSGHRQHRALPGRHGDVATAPRAPPAGGRAGPGVRGVDARSARDHRLPAFTSARRRAISGLW